MLPPCTSARYGWRRSARMRASASARGCTWTCMATGEECEMDVTTAISADPICREHLRGREHPERPERFDAIVEALRQADLLERVTRLDARAATKDELALC